MFKKLLIRNFQSHKNTDVEFDPGVNVIAGASDSGKSSMFRSLIWVINNRPLGDSVRNWKCKKDDEVYVEIELGNEPVSIAKNRIGKTSSYVLRDDVEAISYEAFKQDVPDEIRSALNMSEINIQSQHDSYFLLNDSPGEVARKLNELTGLDVIDRLFKFINGKILSTKRLLDDASSNIITTTNDIEGLSYIDTLEGELEALEVLINDYNKKVKEQDDVHSLIISLEDIDEKIKDYEDWLTIENEYEALNQKVKDYVNKKTNYHLILSIVANIENIENQITSKEKIANESKSKYEKLLKTHGLCPLCGSKISDKMLKGILL